MRDALLTTVPTKKPKVSVVMDEELKAALEAWAAQESRTVSNLCELILRDAARENGYLK
ncbi:MULTISPECIES: ribbon-helix-helix domain-containing protein [Cyanophyceae]|uniref:CopG-like ribbon-helix-helix domain-containing protein n=1 Tax=Leptolyngbya subtilissima DQ-A4 TaxID=2933933 RepID=A0ABV0KBE8_9CYAN|nr:CopG family transcriptional regulator [Nodosilinea sp. FACHB-141]MBD2115078.1 CopG family transcriptional regulator [Nodosilinea sp. FACHB-141]